MGFAAGCIAPAMVILLVVKRTPTAIKMRMPAEAFLLCLLLPLLWYSCYSHLLVSLPT